MQRVLFICTGNIARSQMAEALLRFHAGDRFEVHSAGLEPKTIPAETIAALREAGVPIADDARSKHMDEFRGQQFDYVITVCDSARQTCPYFPGENVLHWDIEDPAVAIGDGTTRMDAFRKARDAIRPRIIAFLREHGCVFCRIVAGEAPASLVYEDDLVVAFLDVRPVNDGHALVIPRQHHETADKVSEEIAGRMHTVAGKIAKALQASAVQMEGYNLWVANGEAAGQEVFHVHLHVLPRFKGDGVRAALPAGLRPPPRTR
ncbi:MAG TPA: HIT domain-containing protein [Dehalococcoidia bacterium]|nr:HIT domain-containing protein [Dehalococcoidia bacterium]